MWWAADKAGEQEAGRVLSQPPARGDKLSWPGVQGTKRQKTRTTQIPKRLHVGGDGRGGGGPVPEAPSSWASRPASPDPPLLQLAQVGIPLQDFSNGFLLLLCQEAEVQQLLGLGLWLMRHEGARWGPETLLRWVAALGHQLGQCPRWVHMAAWGQTGGQVKPCTNIGHILALPAPFCPNVCRGGQSTVPGWLRARGHEMHPGTHACPGP